MQRDLRIPAQQVVGSRDVRLALSRIVSRQREVSEARLRLANFDHLFRELLDGELTGISEIHRIVQVLGIHETNQTLDEIVDVTE
jgi:hypothetical protein